MKVLRFVGNSGENFMIVVKSTSLYLLFNRAVSCMYNRSGNPRNAFSAEEEYCFLKYLRTRCSVESTIAN